MTSATINSDVTALILAGGRATRMGGIDKGLVELSGLPLAQRVLNLLQHQVGDVLISANRNRDVYAAMGAKTVSDFVENFAGPLAGMAAGIKAAQTKYLFVCPCDSPFIGNDIVARLHARMLETNAEIVVAHDGQRPQPVFALMRCSLLASMVDFLERGERKIMFWYKQHDLRTADFSDCLETFDNINTPEDVARAEAQLVAGANNL
ncbi:MAG: molybdenum cofactor guanylyltransferase MobA [Pseudomonadota bacterium]